MMLDNTQKLLRNISQTNIKTIILCSPAWRNITLYIIANFNELYGKRRVRKAYKIALND